MGIASRAFTARFMITCSTWFGSALIRPRPLPSTVSSRMLSPMRRRSSSLIPTTTQLRSMSRGCKTCLRLNASSLCVKAAARAAAFSISSRFEAASSSCWQSRSMAAYPKITVRRLLKSCATPPARRPTASIFNDWRNCSSSSWCSTIRRSTRATISSGAICSTLRLGLRIRRQEPAGDPREPSAWQSAGTGGPANRWQS